MSEYSSQDVALYLNAINRTMARKGVTKVITDDFWKDEIVPIQASKELAISLQRNQVVVETCFFEGGHEIQQNTIPIIQGSLFKWFI